MGIWDGVPREVVRTFGPNVLNQEGENQSRVYDVSDVPPGGCLYSQNMRFWGASVSSRYGIYSPLFNAAKGTGADPTGLSPCNSIADLYVLTPTTTAERYVYTDPTDNRRIDCYFKDTAQAAHLVSGTPAVQGFSCTPVGVTHIIAGYDAALSPCFNPIRVDFTKSPADLANLEKEEVFIKNPGITSATTASQNTGGLVTTGTHQVGYVFLTRFGTYTKPVAAGPVTIASGDTGAVGLTLVPSAAWPAEYKTAYVVLTTSTSSTRYFLISDSAQTVPSGTTTSIVWNPAGSTAVTAADSTLESYAEATNWFTYMRADSTTGLLPVTPFFSTQYGNRTVYLVQRVAGTNSAQVLVSENNKPADLSLDQHVLFLPTAEQLTGAYEVGGVLVVSTSSETWTFMDTGDVPALWPSPNKISSTLGQAGPQAAVANDNGIGAYVKTKDGSIFYFDASGYSRRPLSALIYENKFDDQTDPATKLTLDPRENLLYVCYADATDTALNATPGAVRKDRKRCMVFEVSGGIGPDEARLSEWEIGSGSTRIWLNKVVINPNVYQTSGNRGAIFALCHETFAADEKCAIGLTQIFNTGGNPARDRVRYIDDAAAAYYLPMTCKYFTGYFPSTKEATGDALAHLGLHFGMRGSGTVDISVKMLNRLNVVPLAPLAVSYAGTGAAIVGTMLVGTSIVGYAGPTEDAPTQALRRQSRLKADKWSYQFTFTSDPATVSSFFQLTEVCSYFQEWASRR